MAQGVPRHVAIIMDGNGRWAVNRGLPRIRGHEEGAESVNVIVTACREMGVEALTLYSFSTENWRRPKEEVTALMRLLHRYVKKERRQILDNGIQLRAIGQVHRLPIFVRKPLQALCRETATVPLPARHSDAWRFLPHRRVGRALGAACRRSGPMGSSGNYAGVS